MFAVRAARGRRRLRRYGGGRPRGGGRGRGGRRGAGETVTSGGRGGGRTLPRTKENPLRPPGASRAAYPYAPALV